MNKTITTLNSRWIFGTQAQAEEIIQHSEAARSYIRTAIGWISFSAVTGVIAVILGVIGMWNSAGAAGRLDRVSAVLILAAFALLIAGAHFMDLAEMADRQ